MSILYNEIEFEVVDNLDGTFTLTPVAPATLDAIRDEYRAVRDEVKSQVLTKQSIQGDLADINASLTALRAQRDGLKAAILAYDPDGDE